MEGINVTKREELERKMAEETKRLMEEIAVKGASTVAEIIAFDVTPEQKTKIKAVIEGGIISFMLLHHVAML